MLEFGGIERPHNGITEPDPAMNEAIVAIRLHLVKMLCGWQARWTTELAKQLSDGATVDDFLDITSDDVNAGEQMASRRGGELWLGQLIEARRQRIKRGTGTRSPSVAPVERQRNPALEDQAVRLKAACPHLTDNKCGYEAMRILAGQTTEAQVIAANQRKAVAHG